MFAIVRTGGKQYRVAPGDKIVVEKLAGEAGDSVDLTDVLLAGEGSDLKSTAGLTVGARIVAQAKGEKVTVFKKRRRHNYRRKKGHRQQHTILEIVSIGGHKAQKAPAEKKAAPSKAEGAAPKAEVAEKPAAAPAKPVPSKVEGAAAKPAAEKKAAAPKAGKAAAPKKEAAPKAAKASTKDAAPAKAAAKKAPAAKSKK